MILKVREDEDFHTKSNVVIEELNKLGIDSKSKIIPTIKSKKCADVVPYNVKWSDTKLSLITSKKPNFEKTEIKIKKIKLEE